MLRKLCGLEQWLGSNWELGFASKCSGWRDGLAAKDMTWSYLWEAFSVFLDEKVTGLKEWSVWEFPDTIIGVFWWVVVSSFLKYSEK
jgi:hypothetical protein